MTDDGVIVIKSQAQRSRERNKIEAFNRLRELILKAIVVKQKRIATKPSRNSAKRRMDSKTKRSKTKSLRGKIDY